MRVKLLLFISLLCAYAVGAWAVWEWIPLPELEVKKEYTYLEPKDPKVFTPAMIRKEFMAQLKVIKKAQAELRRSIEPLSQDKFLKESWYRKLAYARKFAYHFNKDLRDEEGVLQASYSLQVRKQLAKAHDTFAGIQQHVLYEQERRVDLRRKAALTPEQKKREREMQKLAAAMNGRYATLGNVYASRLHRTLNKIDPVSQAKATISSREWSRLKRGLLSVLMLWLISALFFLLHIWVQSDFMLYMHFNKIDVFWASFLGPISFLFFLIWVETDALVRCTGARYCQPERGEVESKDGWAMRLQEDEKSFRSYVYERAEQILLRRKERRARIRQGVIFVTANALSMFLAMFGAPIMLKAAPKSPKKSSASSKSQKKKQQFSAGLAAIIETTPASGDTPATPFIILRGTTSFGGRHKLEAVFQSLPQLPTSILRLGFSSGVTPGLRLGALAGLRMEHGSGDFVPDLELRLIASGKGFESFNLIFLQLNIREMVPQFAWFSTLSYTLSFWKWLSFGVAFEGRVSTRNWYLKAGPMLRAGPMQFWFYVDRDGAFVPSAMFVLKM